MRRILRGGGKGAVKMDVSQKLQQELIEAAQQARRLAYSPYSHISVGAALLGKNGAITGGCNIENASYSATICAERVAFSRALFAGEQKFAAIAIVGGPTGEPPRDYFFPCGVCRQWMAEFCANDFLVIAAKDIADYQGVTLAELLPHSFGPGQVSL